MTFFLLHFRFFFTSSFLPSLHLSRTLALYLSLPLYMHTRWMRRCFRRSLVSVPSLVCFNSHPGRTLCSSRKSRAGHGGPMRCLRNRVWANFVGYGYSFSSFLSFFLLHFCCNCYRNLFACQY